MVKPAVIAAAFAFLAPVLIGGCAEEGMVETIQSVVGEKEAFEQAQADGSAREWSAFIEKYPQSDRIDEARRQWRAALWRETSRSQSPSVYLDFIANYPQNSHVHEAKEDARRLLLAGKGSSSDLSRYLNAFPDDGQAPNLRRILEKNRFVSAKESSDPEAASLFVAEYPGTREAAIIKKKSEADKYQMARSLGTRLAYHWFLNQFPDSSKAAAAKSHLSSDPPQYYPVIQGVDVGSVINQMRLKSPDFRRYECWEILSRKIRHERDLFGSRAENLRDKMRNLFQSDDSSLSNSDGESGDSGDMDGISAGENSSASPCSTAGLSVPSSRKQIVINAIGALNKLGKERARISSLVGNPQALANEAQSLSQTASSFADDAEGKEEEEDTLYGQGSENPDDPKETASEVARDAARRARYSLKILQSAAEDSDAGAAVDKMDSQAKLLMLIIAESEK